MENIAIVGIANLFPGASTPDSFWQQLLDKQDNRTLITRDELGVEPNDYLGNKGGNDKFYCLYGGYIRDFKFDAQEYVNSCSNPSITAEYLSSLDDLHKWSLYVTKQALVDAGYWQSEKLNQCGLILGNLSFPTKQSNQLFLESYRQVVELALKQTIASDFQLQPYMQAQQVAPENALVAGYPAALLASINGLGANYFALDAACASSCYSIKLACDYLNMGKADMMLAGAVSAADSLFVNMGFSIFQAFPENNCHAPLDQNSQGLFAAQGAGMMVLKRHKDAVADGDHIYAVIKGGALTNDGKGEFVLSPNSKGQVLAYQKAYQDAQIEPSQVDFIECHATGTPKGDKVELSSMQQFFSEYQHKPLLGSAKSNLGHLLTAAGMPAMTKAIYALNEKKIPATINVNQPITLQQEYFDQESIPTDTTDWPKSDHQATAGVSVFGFGGSNAHIVLQAGDSAVQEQENTLKNNQKLAIVGMDCTFGSVDKLTRLQQVLSDESACFRELPKQRWQGLNEQQTVLNSVGLKQAPLANYIEQFSIDFLRFKIPPNDQDSLIPQQLLMMKVADNALKDANISVGSNVAVIVAMGLELNLHQYRARVNLASQIQQSLIKQGIELSQQQLSELQAIAKQGISGPAQLNQYTSFIGNIMASRISALWDFSGPAFTLSSEENSVYKCIDVADNLLATSDVEAVVIAAVDLAGSFENISLRHSSLPVAEQAQVASTPFEQQQWLAGEGAGALVVKASDKVKGDESYAIIEAVQFTSGQENNDLAVKAALQKANISAEQVSLVEAYAVGCDEQLQAEKSTLLSNYHNAQLLSSKQVLGHLFNASGMVSLFANVLRMKHSGEETYSAINGLGKDNCAAHLILSNLDSGKEVTDNLQDTNNKPALLKTVKLGGKTIFDRIVAEKNNPIIKQVRAKFLAQNSDSEQVTQSISNQHNIDEALLELTLSSVNDVVEQQNSMHQAFLTSRFTAQQQIASMIEMQAELYLNQQQSEPSDQESNIPLQHALTIKGQDGYHYPDLLLKAKFNQPDKVVFNTQQLVEFAEGKIANVFGEKYSIIDNYHRRVRLPTTDYLLVSRVTDLDAQTDQYKKSSMTTEYDIPLDAPFLIDGQIPWSVSVESGQCDLMLISYIGIDFQNKGERVYRLLDCELTFLEEMAFGGETLRYEIHIDSYAKNGEQLLFFFHYDCYVGDKKVLIMRNGCAGFFTDEELADGKGVIATSSDEKQIQEAQKRSFTPLINNQQTQFDYQAMLKLVDGDITGCFGSDYEQFGRNPSLKFSSEKFLMIESVTKIQPQGGHWGLGLVEGQKQLEPEHWYFPCHFKDDQVMAGSLMSEGCGQLAMFYMLWLGMNINVNNARFQPMPGEPQTVRCRGQVTPQSNVLTYRMEVTDLGMSPRPYIKANIDIILDGKVVVDFKNLCVEIKEQDSSSPYPVVLPGNVQLANQSNKKVVNTDESNETVDQDLIDERGIKPYANLISPLMRVQSDHSVSTNKGVVPIQHYPAPYLAGQNRVPDSLPFTPWHLFEFATGDISLCFGKAFSIYEGRTPPRTPCGDLQLVSRVVDVQGTRMDFKNPASCIAEYDVPEDAWYFDKNSINNWMPYSVLMEIALQPNGFISAYMGSTLTYPEKDLYFRNLDGQGELLKRLDLRGKTIVNKSVLLSTSMAGGAIIQNFSFDLSVDGETFYRGSAVFGYFSAESLTNQLGIDNGQITNPWFVDNNTPAEKLTQLKLTDKSLSLFTLDQDKPHYRLAGGQLNFVDEIAIVEGGGDYQLAYIYGERNIDASDWFFRYHFHQDPVMPGSLGVEAIIELLQSYALHNDLGKSFNNPRFISSQTKVTWKYRGQITPLNKKMNVDIHLKEIIKTDSEVRLVGDANLSKDGLRIYHVQDIVLSIVEAERV